MESAVMTKSCITKNKLRQISENAVFYADLNGIVYVLTVLDKNP
jgi:hypothetical protein